MKLCSYEKGCKNWVVDSEKELCPLHAGILIRTPSPEEIKQKQRFDNHVSIADMMSNDQLAAHILQLESLLEDVKLRQQAAASVKSRRLREANSNGTLTEAQQAEISALRGPKAPSTRSSSEPKISKEEKEIQKLMKLGFSREKAILMMGMD